MKSEQDMTLSTDAQTLWGKSHSFKNLKKLRILQTTPTKPQRVIKPGEKWQGIQGSLTLLKTVGEIQGYESKKLIKIWEEQSD